jgi:hypothetical protein
MAADLLPTLVPVAGFFFVLFCCTCGAIKNTWSRVSTLTARVQHLEEQQVMQQAAAPQQIVIPVQQQQQQVTQQPYIYRQAQVQHPLFQVAYPTAVAQAPAPTAPNRHIV